MALKGFTPELAQSEYDHELMEKLLVPAKGYLYAFKTLRLACVNCLFFNLYLW